jgi:hypothetical protein
MSASNPKRTPLLRAHNWHQCLQGANSGHSSLGKPGKASEFKASIYANFKHPSIEYIATSALRLDLSLAQQKAGTLLVTFHKRILEWQADHPNITWLVGALFGRLYWCFFFCLDPRNDWD